MADPLPDFESSLAELEAIVARLERRRPRARGVARPLRARRRAVARLPCAARGRRPSHRGAHRARRCPPRARIAHDGCRPSLTQAARPDAFTAWVTRMRAGIDTALASAIPAATPAVLDAGMRYALLGGGKRVRPLLALATAEAILGSEAETCRLAMPAACALEMIHTYSLVHDDLPAMDDDDLRRGRATTHVVYGEGLAILVGDGLLTEAFAWLAREPDDAHPAIVARKLRAIGVIARAAGATGMVGGQAIDLDAVRPMTAPRGRRSTPRRCADMHARKTGALIRGRGGRRRDDGRRRQRDARRDRRLRARARPRLPDRRRRPRRRGHVGRRWARRPARTPRPASRPTRRSTGSSARRPRRRGARPRPRRARDGAARRAPRAARRPLRHETRVKTRLDALLVARGLAASRERARALILAGQVRVDGQAPPRPARWSPTTPHVIARGAGSSVGRPRRPEARARARRLRPRRRAARRRSTSARRPAASPTCCSQRGAGRVVALDVGHGQLDWRLRTDPRVVVLEGVNARHRSAATTCPAALARSTSSRSTSRSSRCGSSCRSCRRCSGRDARRRRARQAAVRGGARRSRQRGGIVRDPAVHARVVDEVAAAAACR